MFDSKETVKAQMNALFKALVWPDQAEVACVSPLPCDRASIGGRLSLPQETKSHPWTGGEQRHSTLPSDA